MSRRLQSVLERLESRDVPAAVDYIAVGGPSGVARLYDTDGTLQFHVRPFETVKPATVQVAVGDVTGDEIPDLITAVGLASGARVKVFNGTDGSPVATFAAFPASMNERVSVAAADFNGDGHTDVAIAAGLRPRVKIFDGQTLSVLESFSVAPWSRGGVRLTTGDVSGDGAPDLVAAHAVGAPRVVIYDGSQILSAGSPRKLLPDFFPFARTLKAGVQVAAADVQNDGFADLIFGGGGKGRQVIVWDGKEFTLSDGASRVVLLNSTLAGAVAASGVRVGSTDVNGDDQADVLVANGLAQEGSVKAYLSSDFSADPTVVVSLPNFSTSSVGANHEPTVSVSAPRVLLTPGKLAALRQQASTNSPQWQAFKSRLDQGLTRILNSGDYQGWSLGWIADYSLGYQVLKESDPGTAANYADKAIAIMKSGLRDFQKAGWQTRQFLARGNGSTTSFALPHSDINPSTIRVYLGSISTQAVVRGNTDSDTVSWYSKYLKVSNTSDGPADYLEGVHWSHNSALQNDQLDWSLPASQPSAGSTYYVTLTSPFTATMASFTFNGNSVILNSAPSANQAVFVEYIYGTHSENGSTLAYQQTSSGDGGFNSIMIDSSYTSRYLGKNLAIGYDWLYDYIGFSPALKAETASLLVGWSDYVRDHGYARNSPASNYGVGGYVSRMLTALALSDGRDPNGSRLLNEIVEYRANYVVPVLESNDASLKGGFWAEGWSYGDLATQNLLLAGLAFEQGGLGSATLERTWASEVTRHIVAAQPTPTTVYDGGDWFAYPAPLPKNDLFVMLAATTTDSAAKAYNNRIIQATPSANSNNFLDLMFRDPAAETSFWSSEPLTHRAIGTGLVIARADWNYNSTFVSFQLGNLLGADHQSYSPGQVQIQRGGDGLLINAPVFTNNQSGPPKSRYGNHVIIDDNGEGAQNYRFGMGVWYGTPGVITTAYEATASHVYVAGDYHTAFSKNTNPGGVGSASELTRQVVYLRPDFIVVHDRVTTIKDYYLKQVQWHFLNAPTVSGNSWVETVGSSKLFGETFSSQPLTTTVQQVTVNSKTVSQVATKNANPTASIRYVTALQSAPSTTANMVESQMILSTDGRMEGVQMGNELVLFGTNGTVDPSTAITYTVAGSGQVSHLLTDMQAGRNYQLLINGVSAGSVHATSQGTLSFASAAGATITLT